jgi:hypothetical protein
MGDSCHIHSPLPLPASDHMQGVGYSKSEVDTDAAALVTPRVMKILIKLLKL